MSEVIKQNSGARTLCGNANRRNKMTNEQKIAAIQKLLMDDKIIDTVYQFALIAADALRKCKQEETNDN